jgi:3-hydroxyethyl bacteriochlorophyllide a dehydrogenase
MDTFAVVMSAPERIDLARVALADPAADDVLVEIDWSGISSGTERLLWTGTMPAFPGMGYPLVPGYESVGRVAEGPRRGETVFVPGSRCFRDVRGLFGGAARHVFVPESRVVPVDADLGARAVLLALAATARHALAGSALPELIVGHGVLGRLLARLCVLDGGAPVVWERDPARREGGAGYAVLDPEADDRRHYRCIVDASGDPGVLDALVARLAPGGEIVLAGFYAERLSFAFPPAFMREARLRIAAQWQEADLRAVRDLAQAGALNLDDLLTHTRDASDAPDAYRVAFADRSCLKMVLDWRECR